MISLTMHFNEENSNRAKALEMYCKGDDRFEWLGFSDCPVDVCFKGPGEGLGVIFGQKSTLNVELKEPSDYIQSALGRDGHLYLQSLDMREAQAHSMILVLGGDDDISDAILDSLKTRYHGQALGFQISNYTDRLYDFEAKSYALGCPVMRWKSSPWKRLLSHAHKVLSGCDLLDYRPRPEGERDICALSVLVPGIGPAKAKAILDQYNGSFGDLALMIRTGDGIKELRQVSGIGPKLAEAVVKGVNGAKA